MITEQDMSCKIDQVIIHKTCFIEQVMSCIIGHVLAHEMFGC